MKQMGCMLLILCCVITPQIFAADSELTAEQQAYVDQVRKVWETLDMQQGPIELAGGAARLEVPPSFLFLNSGDAEKLLVDIWGNPPGTGSETLGLLIPADFNPLSDEAWAVTIWYEEDGYVTDDNADDIDYQDLLEVMQENTEEASKERLRKGYEAIRLIGWAAKPYYDRDSHKMYWAKEMQFGEGPERTLNYNIRVLGRKGVLVMNFIASMHQLETINSKLDRVLALADFNQGSRYEDFNPDIDQVAAYGIGALVAGKVLAKTGLLAAALIFLKKFGVVFAIAAFALFGRLFKRRKSGSAE